MAEDKKISQLNPASAFTGVEKFEIVQGGLNLAATPEQMKTYVGAGPTREFDRAFSAELLFDKNQIEGALHTQTAAITFTVAESGNLVDQWSVYGQRIVLDGVNPVFFQGFNHVANIASGDILEAGTYQFIFWYSNGVARGSIMLPRQEVVLLTPLATPTNFAAVPGTDPDTELDLSWTAVANVSSYEIDFSTAGGGGPWTSLTTPASGDTTYTHTGRTPNTTYHYRIRAIGDLVAFSNSQYAITAGTTEDAGDVTAPTFTFLPADAATDIVVNEEVTITASEALIDSDGATEIVDGNVTDYVTASASVSGAVTINGTIDVAKRVLTINPVGGAWPENEDITITIDGVEDLNGNDPAADSATFTTNDFTEMNGNNLSLGTQLDPTIVGADKNFEIELDFNDILLLDTVFIDKYGTGSGDSQLSLIIRAIGNNIEFRFYNTIAIGGIFKYRSIQWPDALLGFSSGKLTWKYFGAVDTNNGLDRVELYKDDVLFSAGKNINSESSGGWPFDIGVSTAPFRLRGAAFREVRNLIVRNNMGATTIVNIPIIRTGEDISGNNFDGTWS